MKRQTVIAQWTHQNDPSDLQLAASQLVPSASSIALSIRELVRQGYLISAFLLVRPLLERAATFSYLLCHPEAVLLWKDGWPHGSRPNLETRMSSIGSQADEICGLTAAFLGILMVRSKVLFSDGVD